MPGWMKHKLESRFPGEISITSDMQMTLPLVKVKEVMKSFLMKVKEESGKASLKLNIQKPTIMGWEDALEKGMATHSSILA